MIGSFVDVTTSLTIDVPLKKGMCFARQSGDWS